jgi:predicted nuclease of restriction endonuclease-like (RecB) superfamily
MADKTTHQSRVRNAEGQRTQSWYMRIFSAPLRFKISLSAKLVQLYHYLGSEILERQSCQGWGAKVIDRLASDLREAFPKMKGFSSSNLKYMRFFAQQCPSGLIGQQAADQLPWFHLVTLLTKVSEGTQREWYAVQTIFQGWSRSTLDMHIKTSLSRDLTFRHGKGFSRSNVIRIRQFYLIYPKGATVSHFLSWSHVVELLKMDDPLELTLQFAESQQNQAGGHEDDA